MKYVKTIVSDALFLLVIFALVLFGAPRLFGIQMMSVLSGSMEPTMPVGTLIYAAPVKAKEDIKPGDSISFFITEDKVATHRVMECDYDAGSYITKGDANQSIDGMPVTFDRVIGVVRLSIPKAGAAIELMSDPKSRILLITAIAALLIGSLIFQINRKPEEIPEDTQQPNPKGVKQI